MCAFFRRTIPEPSRILLVESGSRHITEIIIPRIEAQFHAPIDLLTCFPTAPAGTASVYNVNSFPGRKGRTSLARELRAKRYAIAGIICSNERILNKWKWALAALLPAKIVILNENGDWFWLDCGHWSHIRRFIKHRAGFADAGIVRALARIAIFPFTLSYLLLYAAAAHCRRALNRGFR